VPISFEDKPFFQNARARITPPKAF
jgi:hypothetical protein